MEKILKIKQVDEMTDEKFTLLFLNIIEHCPEATEAVVAKRPFFKVENLINAYWQYLDELDENGRINILKSHPDLGCKKDEIKLTNESQFEQVSAGIEKADKTDKEILQDYNKLYKEKFTFPFVICARQNMVKDILKAIKMRLKNSKIEEIKNGIEEVKKIGKLRIMDIVLSD